MVDYYWTLERRPVENKLSWFGHADYVCQSRSDWE